MRPCVLIPLEDAGPFRVLARAERPPCQRVSQDGVTIMSTSTKGLAMSANDENLGVRVYKGHEIEVDDDGHVTVWQLDGDGPDGDHWTEPSVDAARASIDKFDAPKGAWWDVLPGDYNELTRERDGYREDAIAEQRERERWGL